MSKKDIKREDADKIRIFSKREGDVVCVDGTLVQFQKTVLVDQAIGEWLLKSYPDLMMKID